METCHVKDYLTCHFYNQHGQHILVVVVGMVFTEAAMHFKN